MNAITTGFLGGITSRISRSKNGRQAASLGCDFDDANTDPHGKGMLAPDKSLFSKRLAHEIRNPAGKL